MTVAVHGEARVEGAPFFKSTRCMDPEPPTLNMRIDNGGTALDCVSPPMQ